jgi:glycerol uptake facilitator-like aquaporin
MMMNLGTFRAPAQSSLLLSGGKHHQQTTLPLYNSPSSSASSSSSGSQLENSSSSRWRSMMDNCMVEFVSALFLILTTVFCWGWKTDDRAMQFIPPLALGLILLCLKDEDYFFPDGSWTVTIVLWALGGYGSWTHVVARLVGQTIALAVALAICSAATVPDMIIHVHHPFSVVFVMELFATTMEHMAVVYVIMPLLPPSNSHGANFLFPKVKPKSDTSTKAPSNQVVMHAAVTFSTLHWTMWRGFGTEMNPAVTIVLAFLRHRQPEHSQHAWEHATMAIWGQLVGLFICIVYTAVYIPRESKLWKI